jgi:hypothetical protein
MTRLPCLLARRSLVTLAIRLTDAAAGGDGALGEAEHVGAKGVLSTSASFGRREYAIGVDLALEAAKESFAGWPGAATAVSGPAP